MAYDYPPIGSPDRPPFDTIIDVRSPDEFADDHIPGAINLPALSNAERARVGTIYVQESRFRARRIGAAIVARNVATYLDTQLSDKCAGWRPLIYCWRGGQRSGSVATILRQIGWQVETLAGGYKSYRSAVHAYLYATTIPHRLVLLEGYTGTAKTELLGLIEDQGHQVLDLEGLARHRGSLFGAVAGGQPSQKTFESQIAAALGGLDPARPVVVEAESSKIGDRIVPPALWQAMLQAPRYGVTAPLRERARYTLRTYHEVAASTDRLIALLNVLKTFHGAARVEEWVGMARAADLIDLVEDLLRDHYDPRYRKSATTHGAGRKVIGTLDLPRLDPPGLAQGAQEIARHLDRFSLERLE